MEIVVKDYNDGFEWEKEYYKWIGNQWVHRIEGNENKSGMMIPFANAEYNHGKKFTEEDKLAILKHFNLTPGQVPLDKVLTSSPKYLEGIVSRED